MPQPSDGPVLILAPTGRDGILAAQTLGRAGLASCACRDLGELAEAIGPAAGAVVLAQEALEGASVDALLARLGAQEPWSDLPVLLLTAAEGRGRPGPEAAAVLAPATFVTLLERPFRTATLVSAVETALRARRRQWQVRDLLVQRRADERALHESEERLRVATESAGVGTWDLSLGDGRLVWNDHCRAHFGLRPGEPVDMDRFYAGLHPEDRAPTEAAVRGAMNPEGPGRYAVEYRTVSPQDGGLRWIAATGRAVFDHAGRPARFSGTTVDITERKRAELGLAEAHRFLHSAMDALTSHVAVLDHEGKILAVNAAWRRFADENRYGGENYAIGSNYLREGSATTGECVEPDPIIAGLRDVMEGRSEEFEWEYPCHSPTEQRWFVMRVSPFHGGPPPRKVVVAHENITPRKLALLDLERAKEELESANAAKDHFLAMLSHELRTPLTPVLLCLAGRAGDDALPADLREDLAMIRRCVELEARLIDDLLDLTRVARGKLELHAEPGDAHAIVRAAVEICAAGDDARGRPPVELRLEAREHHVQADRARLQQVFWNLVNNALKFTPDGGRVAVRTHNPRPGCLALEVRDEGIGIAPGRIGELFGAFEQGGRAVTRRFGGLGLGLAISKALVDLHGGRIFAASEGIGHGSVFTVELDTRTPPRSEAARSPEGEVGDARPLRVLLVEDNAPTLSALSRLLRRAGHEVRGASSLGEAREAMADESFDLLLSDLGLPDGSGIDLVREGGERLPPTRIALSGYGMEADVRACLDAGFQSHVTKPVDWPRLVRIIRELTAARPPAGL